MAPRVDLQLCGNFLIVLEMWEFSRDPEHRGVNEAAHKERLQERPGTRSCLI